MTRVSEGSSFHAINYSVGKTKSRLEDLQLKGSNLKRVQKPSDDPVGNVELLAIRSQAVDSEQYLRNVSYAKAQLAFTENAVEELTNIMVKAKELAIGQASSLYDADIRKNVSREINQLKKQLISIGNRRLGSKYIFGGHKSLTLPFNEEGKYQGDAHQTKIEVAKDFFVPVNFSGQQVFFDKKNTALIEKDPLSDSPLKDVRKATLPEEPESPFQQPEDEMVINRTPATQPLNQTAPTSVIDHMDRLENALLTNNPEIIQEILPVLDEDIDRLIEVRTKIGSVVNSIDNAEANIEKTNILNAEYRTKIEDVDVAQLFTDLTRQQNTLNATYKSSAQLMNKSLLNFLN